MDVRTYLARIGIDSIPPANRGQLEVLMQAHLCSVPFENLDVQLGRPLTTAVGDAYGKIVGRGRGGWCYEQNGLFGWALGALGFEVMRMAGAVRTDTADDTRLDNHLVLAVTCPDDGSMWLVDVGFGGSHFAPLRFEPHSVQREPFDLQLERLPEGRWRYTERYRNSASMYDFAMIPADESALAVKCASLQTDPESSFVLNLVVQRRTPTTHISLRGRVLAEKSIHGETKRRLESAEELVQILSQVFGLDVAEARSLWPRIVARHEELGLD